MQILIELDRDSRPERRIVDYIKTMARENGVPPADYVIHLLEKGVTAEQSEIKSQAA